MSEHIITIGPAEARITIDHGAETATAHAIAFDANAQIISEIHQRFSGFCDTEIIEQLVTKLLLTRHIGGVVLDMPDITTALSEAQLRVCTCDD